MKFGMLGNMRLDINSYFNLDSEGLKIKVSNVFLCLEMLDVEKWTPDLIKKKYQQAKKASLQTILNNAEIMFADLIQSEASSFSPAYIQKILANTSIEIENVYLMYEDKSFNFQIGLLLPKIEVKSVNKLGEIIENVEDCSVIYKLLQVQDVSLIVNHTKITPISNLLANVKIDQEKRSFSKQAIWSKEDCNEVGLVIERHLRETFEDSNQRFSRQHDTKHNYVFLEKFTIELKVQVTLNKSIAQELDLNFSEPDLLL